MGIESYRMDQTTHLDQLQRRARRALLGDDDAWGATLATGPLGIYTLAAFALLMQVIDLTTGIWMMQRYGVAMEQNPVARFVMSTAGPLALVEVKLIVVGVALLLLVRTAMTGHPRLARNCLLLAAGLGMLGWTSNLVG